MAEGNGPSKAEFVDALADFEELRLAQMSIMAKQAQVLDRWEGKGGHRDDLRDGFKLSQMDVGDREREARRQMRVHGYMGITVVEATGQESFAPTFDQAPEPGGAGGAELGSRLSLVRAESDGFNSGKHPKGEQSKNPWPENTKEHEAWLDGYGRGAEYRKPPKPPKQARAAAEGTNGAEEAETPPAEEGAAPPVSDKPGWDPVRDFTDETTGPVH